MRLLHTNLFELMNFGGSEVPKYAILSHTWGKEEITLQDIQVNKPIKSEGYEKVRKACSVAAADGFDYIWIDTCCIDKTSSAELSEALNSMYRWYQEAEQCYAYLVDVQHDFINEQDDITNPEFQASRWFTRGWTLQELIAPSTVIFFDSLWRVIGTKSGLQQVISKITGIPGDFLLGDDIEYASVAQRMSWASKRETTRTEDLAYCLMGLFGIYMPMLYGEGERAFIRLQEEIMRVSDDHSLFAWKSTEDHRGILATSPAAFADSGNIIPMDRSSAISDPSTISSRGVCLSLRFIDGDRQGIGRAILHCTEIGKENMRLAIHLRDVFLTKQDFVREQSSTLELIDPEKINLSRYPLTPLYLRQWRPTRNRKWEGIEKCVIKLEGVKGQEVALRTASLDCNYELFEGLIIINTAAVLDETLGRLLVVCKDGNFFHIALKKHGRSLSAEISTSTELEDPIVHLKVQNDQDPIVKELGGGHNVHIAIKRRVLLLREGKCLTGVVEISYSSTLEGLWLEHIGILGNLIRVDNYFSYAALRGLTLVFKNSLDQGSLGSNLPDKSGRTPLSWAAEGRQEATIKFLLAKTALSEEDDKVRDSWIDSKDSMGRTPLSYAAEQGHDTVAQILLDTGKIDADSKDIYNLTPLFYATLNRREGFVRLLLDTGEVDANSRDNGNRTPLWHAASNGNEAIVQLLLSIDEVNVNSRDKRKLTPLSLAAQNGHEAVIRLLLNTGKVNVNSKDSWRVTPLSHAAQNGHVAVVRLLLDTERIDADLRDYENRTPLSHAAWNGHETIVQLLLNRDEVDTNSKDQSGLTPLMLAILQGHEAVVQLLLSTGKVDVNSKDNWNKTPIYFAIKGKHEAIVRLLLNTNEVDISTKDEKDWTPFDYAANLRYDAIAQMLREYVK